MVTKHIVVLPYDAAWEQNFTAIKNEIQQALGELALRIEHVGSTSVKGLSAKPIIDMDVVIRDNSVLDAVIAAQLLRSEYGRAAIAAYVQDWLGEADSCVLKSDGCSQGSPAQQPQAQKSGFGQT